MEVEIIKDGKNEIELRIDNTTIAEILRVYLYEAGAEFAAWKREHPSKPAIMLIKSSGKSVKKCVAEAVAAIKKDAGALASAVKK